MALCGASVKIMEIDELTHSSEDYKTPLLATDPHSVKPTATTNLPVVILFS